MYKCALFVGNGFTLDLLDFIGSECHSSYPLKHFKSLKINYNKEFMDHLPYIKEELLGKDINDFQAIENYIDSFKSIEEEYRLVSKSNHPNKFKILLGKRDVYDRAIAKHIQLRRFLAMSYSVLQMEIYNHDIRNWKWIKWLHQNRNKLAFSISLNYDLVLENALQLAEISLFRVGTNEIGCLPVIKPHGSIDFDMPDGSLNGTPWDISGTLNDFKFVKTIPVSEWLNPRMEADIISPSLYNFQLQLSWISKMYDQYSLISEELDAFIIMGCSYWDVDRPEIDFLLGKLRHKTKVYVIDKNPSPVLKKKIQGLGLSYKEANNLELPW